MAAGCVGAVAWASAAVPAAAARVGAETRAAALTLWQQAELGRETLEGINEEARTKADYTRAMDGYRAIYHANPADVHAPMAINAVAELLAEQGRILHDAKSLNAAVGQYEFLRKQYPISPLRAQALLAEGQIAQNDLNDVAMAREKYKQLLKEHPKSEQAEEARAGLASLVQAAGRAQGAGIADSGTGKTAVRVAASPSTVAPMAKSVGTHDAAAMPRDTSRDTVGAQPSLPSQASSSLPSTPQTSLANPASSIAASRLSANAVRDASAGSAAASQSTRRNSVAMNAAIPVAVPAVVAHSGKRALVTGIRHWSTATYTRVAIDLGDNVTYEAARVPNPDRIYFDLHGTRLAPELVGKSFAVTDDGFLKKVRAAQYTDDVTRVVLDVNDVTEYSAFLLPNPYRLIIDIHGGSNSASKPQAVAGAELTARGFIPAPPDVSASGAPTPDVPAPRAAVTVKPTVARPVPNTVATKSTNSASEVADLSRLPGKVEATSRPTSKPISAVVDAGSRDAGTGIRNSSDAAGVSVASATPAPSSLTSASSANSLTRTRRGKTRTGAASAASTVADATPARAAVPTADGETSLVRALGLKIGRIVIDAGHGGHDSGTLGVDGIEEKDVVLDVALRVGKLLHDRLGAEIIYTRSDDTFIPLETRTAIANKAQADLFLSIHANSSSDSTARGVETYYLNFTSDPTALDVAARENAVSDQSIHQLSDLVKKIALKDKIAESREFAADVESSLYAGLQKGNAGLKDRGVKKAPFVVLIGANMPSILAEISFVTNPRDAEQLRDPEYRERVAESLYKGVAKYEGGLSGVHAPSERAALVR